MYTDSDFVTRSDRGVLNLVLGEGIQGFPSSLCYGVAKRSLTVRTNNDCITNNGPKLGVHDGMSKVFSSPAVNFKPFHVSCAI